MTNYVKSTRKLTINEYHIGRGQYGMAVYSIETKTNKGERFRRQTEKTNE